MLVFLRHRRTPLHLLASIHWSPQNHLRTLCTPTTISENPSPLVVSYLTDTCGLSPSAALSTAAKIKFTSPKKPDAVLALLRRYGFADTHITSLIAKRPVLLFANPEKTIKPKLDFFLSIGFSGSDIGKLVSLNPTVMQVSLENKLMPCFNTLTTILGSKELATTAIRACSWILHYDSEAKMFSIIELLRNHGISGTNIVKLATRYPRVLVLKPETFEKIFLKVKEIGFNPSFTMSVYSIGVMSGISSSTWDRKLELYRSFGWSDEQMMSAFMKQPLFMLVSEQKVRKVMDFVVNKLHWEPSSVAQWPLLLMMDFERKLFRRYLVWNILESKGLLRGKLRLSTFFQLNEKRFLETYVVKYADEVPELLEAYRVNSL